MTLQVLLNGAPVPQLVSLKSDTSTIAVFTVVSDYPHAAGSPVSVEADSLINIDQVSGVLDGTGRWSFTVGPGMLAKGRVVMEVTASGHKVSWDLRFN